VLRQRTESFKAHFDSVPGWTGPLASKTVAWIFAGVLILGGLIYGIKGSASPSLEPLFDGAVLRDIELARIELAFSSADLTDYQREEGRILIPRQQRHQYLRALEQASALPYALRMETASDEGAGGFFQSEAERTRRREDDKARHLGSKIMTTFGNIAWASVDYDTRSVGGFDPTVIQSASVVLIPSDGQPIAPAEIRAIRDFVCGAYAGMESDHVTVIDASSRKTFRGDEDPLQRQRRQAEYELEQRLSELLSGYKGLRIAATSEVIQNRTDVGEAEPATPATAKILPVGGAGLSMRISVGVPESQFHRQWIGDYHARFPNTSLVQRPTPEQVEAIKEKLYQNIRDAVTPFIASGDGGPERSVQLWSFPDANHTFRYADDPSTTTTVKSLLANARRHVWLVVPAAVLMLVAIFLGASALVMRFQTTTRSIETDYHGGPPSISRESPPATHPTASPEESKLKDELAEMIEQNPELAAQIVHSWMVDAA